MAGRVFQDDVAELWLGDALDSEQVAEVMGERRGDLLCVDAPYSEKTHAGHAAGKVTADRAAGFGAKANTPEGRYASRVGNGARGMRDIEYAAWSPEDVAGFCALWAPRIVGWCVSITDDVLAPRWAEELERAGRYRFAPLPLVETGSRVRMLGDGPSNWTCWIVVARPRTAEFAKWGTLPGAYVQPSERDINSKGGSDRVVGGKPLRAMCGIVRDYSRPGGLVVDPCCGGGTTGAAAKMLGRRFIGMDTSRDRLDIAARKLTQTRQQVGLFAESAPEMVQEGLFGQ